MWRPQGDSKARPSLGSSRENPRENKGETEASRGAEAEATAAVPSVETLRAEVSDAELERAIVAAMLDGRGAVGEVLAERLKARTLARAGVVAIDAARSRKEGR
jgi:hypothetical protein